MSVMKNIRDPYKVEVGRRLQVTAQEFGFATTAAFARHLKAERGAVDAWFNGRALPPVPFMVKFCSQFSLTLDWIYKGDRREMPLWLNIRLTGLLEGDDVPPPCRKACGRGRTSTGGTII